MSDLEKLFNKKIYKCLYPFIIFLTQSIDPGLSWPSMAVLGP